MPIRVAINGFGRIGRMAFRAIAREAEFANLEVVAINDLLEPDYLAYMLKYDSVHGHFDGKISVDGCHLVVNGKKIRLRGCSQSFACRKLGYEKEIPQ